MWGGLTSGTTDFCHCNNGWSTFACQSPRDGEVHTFVDPVKMVDVFPPTHGFATEGVPTARVEAPIVQAVSPPVGPYGAVMRRRGTGHQPLFAKGVLVDAGGVTTTRRSAT